MRLVPLTVVVEGGPLRRRLLSTGRVAGRCLLSAAKLGRRPADTAAGRAWLRGPRGNTSQQRAAVAAVGSMILGLLKSVLSTTSEARSHGLARLK